VFAISKSNSGKSDLLKAILSSKENISPGAHFTAARLPGQIS
jgi:AAA15 family ATPase/GTPase